jgi:predicted Zn-dependent protease
MSALDFRAKALAMLNQFDEADITIREAENIWQASAREDQVRYCELQFTRGLILMRKNEFSAGIRYLENSVAFNTPNPCVKALHYRRLAAAYFELNRSGDGERASAAARAEQISW